MKLLAELLARCRPDLAREKQGDGPRAILILVRERTVHGKATNTLL